MKNDLPFDEFIKNQFSNSTAEVPERVWDNIIAARRSSRPKGFWLFGSTGKILLVAASLFILGAGTYYLLSEAPATTSTAATTSTNADAGVTGPQTSKLAPGINNNVAGVTNTNVNNAIQMHPVSGTKTSSAGANIHQDKGKAQFSFTNATTGNEVSQQGDDDGASKIDNPRTVTEKDLAYATFPSMDNARQLAAAGNVSQKSYNFPGCPMLERNAAGNKKYWEVYAGPDYVFNNYKTFGDTASYNYLQKRKASTTFTSAFSAGVRYTKVFENGMSIRGGLNYSQVNEKFSYVNPNELKYITVITTRVVVRSPGDTLYLSDTLQYQQSGTHVRTTYNHYRNIDVPLVIGYELGNGKIHANINAGVIINVYSWYKGDVLDTSYQPVTITTGKGTSAYQYRTNIGVGFLGSVSVYYKITDKLHLVIEPYFRYNLSPMSKANLNLQQKDHTVGLRAGLRFDLP